MAAAFLLSPPFGYDAGMSFTYPKIVTPTSSLLVVDLLRDRMDGQIAACVLQGIVNRQREQKAYVMNTYCFDNKRGGRRQAQVAERFLTQLFNDIPTERLAPADDRNWPGFMAMLDRFADCVKGLVIWDPKLEQATIEAATTIAGQTDALVVSPDLAEALSGRGFPIIADLRANEFPGNLECLQWLKEHWFAGSGKEVAFTWSHMTTDGRSWGAANKDFVVAHRLFTFYLDVTRDAEREHYIYILKEYPPGTPVLGWSDERWFDALLARLGYFMVPYISVENLTVHSSFPSTTGTQPPPQPAPVHDDGVYIAFHIADGDNLEHAVTYMPDTIMTSLSYGQVPVTWIVNPGLIDLAPRLFEWYMARLGTQEMAAMMGDGHPGSDRYAAFRFYCDMAHNYMQRAGIRTMKQMAEAEAVAWNVQPYMINSGYAGTDPRGVGPYEYHMDGQTFHIGSVFPKGDVEFIRNLVRNAPRNQPLFLNVFSGTASHDSPAAIQQMAEALKAGETADERRYFFLRSMDLAATYRQWKGLPLTGTPGMPLGQSAPSV